MRTLLRTASAVLTVSMAACLAAWGLAEAYSLEGEDRINCAFSLGVYVLVVCGLFSALGDEEPPGPEPEPTYS